MPLWFANLNVTHKLSLGFGLVLLLMSSTLAVDVLASTQQTAVVNRLVQHLYPARQSAHNIVTLARAADDDAAWYLMLRDTSQTAIYLRTYYQEVQQLRQTVTQTEALADTQVQRQELEQFVTFYFGKGGYYDDTVAAFRQKQAGQIQAAYTNFVDSPFTPSLQVADMYIASVDHEIAQEIAIEYTAARTVLLLSLVLGTLATIIGIGVAVLMINSLRRRDQQLAKQNQTLSNANARLESLATTDPLTSLPNHRTVMSRIEEELSRCRRTQESCAILFVDLDHFKRINDTWGHQAGDAILRETGRRLAATVRLEDFVGRYGGEEFALVLAHIDLREAQQIAERIRIALAATPCLWATDETACAISIPITASIGVAVYQEHGNTREALIEAADNAMYFAKHTGRNRVCLAGEEMAVMQEVLTKARDGRMSEDVAVQALSAVASVHDRRTSIHAQRIVQLAEATASMLGRPTEELHLIRLAAHLHDIGKIGIPDAILHKPGPLTEEEWAVIYRHPELGRQVLVQAGGIFVLLSRIVVAHHEHWDGSGYPYGLAKEAIPLGARILAVVDAYDAMTSVRPYREAIADADARAELKHCAGSQFDPQVVEAFLRTLDTQQWPIESLQVEEPQHISEYREGVFPLAGQTA